MAHENNGGPGGVFARFVHSEVTGSVILLACTVVALAWANSPWSEHYFHLLHTELGFSIAGTDRTLSLHLWINDLLMAIFFFVVGLEIKREMVVGRLSTFDKAILPVAAALGGMIAPALIYFFLNSSGEASRGWGVPVATDIAFALGVLSLFGKRVPIGLKVFLTALAIADDLGAVAVIAIFYTEKTNLAALAVAGLLLFFLFGAIRLGVRSTGVQLILMIAVWLAVFASGVHATIAGILLAMVIPVRPVVSPMDFISDAERVLEKVKERQRAGSRIVTDRDQLDAMEFVHTGSHKALPWGLMLERTLHPVQVWIILPLFALANAGVVIDSHILEALANPISLGVVLGLAVGKPLGILGLSWIAVKARLGALPSGVTWTQILGAGCLAGIGFTMSLFISDLAFADEGVITSAKLGILVASLVSAVIGAVILVRTLPKQG